MKIIHLNTFSNGGAGIAVMRLHLGLLSAGVDSKMLVLHSPDSTKIPGLLKISQSEEVVKRKINSIKEMLIASEFNRYKNTLQEKFEIFTDPRTTYAISKNLYLREADIIHLHWVAGMVDYREFFLGIGNKRIVWTMHDMNPFTGGCHYAGTCINYKNMCGACPMLGSADKNDLSRKNWLRKKIAYSRHDIHIVTPSKWLASCVKQSQIFEKHKLSIIPNSIPTDIFKRWNKNYSREIFGLPQDRIIILFGTNFVQSPRKGLLYLIKAMELVALRNKSLHISLAIFGTDSKMLSTQTIFPIYRLGPVRDGSLLSRCYSASDIFAITSSEDNLPNTALEAMACGIPVVGFEVGGIPDMVRDGETGFLAEFGNVERLAEHIEWLINNPQGREKIGINCQAVVRQEYSNEYQVSKYLDLYKAT